MPQMKYITTATASLYTSHPPFYRVHCLLTLPLRPLFFALLGRPWAERELQWMHMCNIFCRSIKCLFLIGFLEQSEGLVDGQTRILFDKCSAVYNISVFSCHLVRAPIYLTPANRVYQVVMNDRY